MDGMAPTLSQAVATVDEISLIIQQSKKVCRCTYVNPIILCTFQELPSGGSRAESSSSVCLVNFDLVHSTKVDQNVFGANSGEGHGPAMSTCSSEELDAMGGCPFQLLFLVSFGQKEAGEEKGSTEWVQRRLTVEMMSASVAVQTAAPGRGLL